MRRTVITILAGCALVFSAVACQKAEEKPIAPAGQAGQGAPAAQQPQGGAKPGEPGGIFMPAGQLQVVVPDSVKGKWDSVVLSVEDKAAGKSSDVTVKLNSDYQIPNSTLTIKVGDYLPDFKMDGSVITSNSANPNNPAVNIKVMEGQTELFKGWLYSKFPAIHPFQHEKFGVTLKDAKGK